MPCSTRSFTARTGSNWRRQLAQAAPCRSPDLSADDHHVIFMPDQPERLLGVRLRVGTPCGFKSELPSGIVGIRSDTDLTGHDTELTRRDT